MAIPLPNGQIRSNIDFGIVVGVEDYCPLQRLDGAISDAEAFHHWLCDPEGGSVDPECVELMRSDIAGAPQQTDIDRKIEGLLKRANVSGARRLYFYFSGHGAGGDENDVALLLARWSAGVERLALSTHRYSGKLSGIGVFEEVAVFIDCCRTGEFPAIGAAPVIDGEWQARSATRMFVAYATEARQPAYELPGADRWHGIFTRYLLSILRDRSHGGVAAGMLQSQLHLEVPRLAQHCGVIQQPDVSTNFLPASSFGREQAEGSRRRERISSLPFLGRRLYRDHWPELVLTFPTRQGVVVIRDARQRPVPGLRIVGTHRADRGTWRRRLPVGLYLAENRDGTDRVYIWHDGRRPHAV